MRCNFDVICNIAFTVAPFQIQTLLRFSQVLKIYLPDSLSFSLSIVSRLAASPLESIGILCKRTYITQKIYMYVRIKLLMFLALSNTSSRSICWLFYRKTCSCLYFYVNIIHIATTNLLHSIFLKIVIHKPFDLATVRFTFYLRTYVVRIEKRKGNETKWKEKRKLISANIRYGFW